MNKPIRIGIVGLGGATSQMLPCLAALAALPPARGAETAVPRTPSNDALFQKANLGPMLQRGTPKASTIYSLAQALQADTMAKQGIDHLFV